jgi:hypothetical protein
MAQDAAVRWGWLKGMYIYTIVGAGGFGLGIIVMPKVMISVFAWPSQDPIVFGITGSVYLAFALLSVLGLKSPLKFSPLLLLQLIYKAIWLVGVIIPKLIAGALPGSAILITFIYLTYVVGDLVAIPRSYVFGIKPERSYTSEADLNRGVLDVRDPARVPR